MKAKPDPRIDAYIAKSADFAQPILRHLRKLIHTACPEVEETLKWSMPSFLLNGQILCGLAAFKAHCALHFWHSDMEAIIARDGARDSSAAMGHFGRITRLADLPDDQTLLRYFAEAVKLNASGKPARQRATSGTATQRSELPVPTDLAAMLKKNKVAAATFEKFSPSQRREYLEWITEAKRPETREKRLLTTLEWLAEGKTRHWKYANC